MTGSHTYYLPNAGLSAGIGENRFFEIVDRGRKRKDRRDDRNQLDVIGQVNAIELDFDFLDRQRTQARAGDGMRQGGGRIDESESVKFELFELRSDGSREFSSS